MKKKLSNRVKIIRAGYLVDIHLVFLKRVLNSRQQVRLYYYFLFHQVFLQHPVADSFAGYGQLVHQISLVYLWTEINRGWIQQVNRRQSFKAMLKEGLQYLHSISNIPVPENSEN